MKKLVFRLSLATCVLGGCSGSLSDQARISELNRRCSESASETIAAHVSSDSVNLHDVPFPEPVGAAKLPPLDMVYSPYFLVDQLLASPSGLKEVRFTFEVPASKVTNPTCAGVFSIQAVGGGDVRNGFVPCGSRTRFAETFLGRYSIEYVVGPLDKYEIRPFEFRVVDRITRQVVASQRSFQLLMGNMSERETRVLLGWGSAQGVRSCKLSPPATFVKRALGREAA